MKAIIDGNNLAFIGLSAKLASLERDGLDVESLWEDSFRKLFLQQLKNVQKLVGYSYEYYAAWDSPDGAAWRKSISADYKGNRGPKPEYLQKALQIAKDISEELMISNIEIPGAEGDDVIFAFCKNYFTEGVVIISRDKDMLQIVQKGLARRVWNPVTKKDEPVPTYSMVLYKCLAGDKSDGIKGINGVGDKTAIKMIERGLSKKEWESLEKDMKLVDLELNPRLTENQKHIITMFGGE